jgi:hypothetical protein
MSDVELREPQKQIFLDKGSFGYSQNNERTKPGVGN